VALEGYGLPARRRIPVDRNRIPLARRRNPDDGITNFACR
jgi:hypothetical protein